MKRIGIIGVGETVGIADFHELGIRKDGRARISAIYDLNYQNALRWAKAKNLDCIVAKTLDEFFENVDAVDICTPNFTHLEYTLMAIAKNKDFFVEKPSAINLNEAERACKAIAGKNLVNMVGFVYRYSELIMQLKKEVAKRMGKIYTYSAYYGGKRLSDPNIPMEWRFKRRHSGSGAIGDFGSHVVESSMNVCGLKFESVVAKKHTFIDARTPDKSSTTKVENEDSCVFSANDVDGTLISVTVSRVGMDDMNIVITGEGGMMQASIRTPEYITYFEKEIGGAYTGKIELLNVPKDTYYESWFEKQMSLFIDALEGKTKDYPDLSLSFEVMQVLDAVEKAADGHMEIKI